MAMQRPQVPGPALELFHDLHRWFNLQADDIESMKARHHRLNTRNMQAVERLQTQLHRDVAERKKQVNEFSLELEQYTLRKFDLLSDDIARAHLEKSCAETAGVAEETMRKQRQ